MLSDEDKDSVQHVLKNEVWGEDAKILVLYEKAKSNFRAV